MKPGNTGCLFGALSLLALLAAPGVTTSVAAAEPLSSTAGESPNVDRPAFAPGPAARELIASDDFSGDLSQWVVEQTAGGKTQVKNGQLDIDDGVGPHGKGGCTVWFKKKFTGPIMIEYEATMVKQGGPNDRCSDLNCFWMAIDPRHPDNLFADSAWRGGIFRRYFSLRLYYVGYGANNNTTTRFRRFPGDGTRPLLGELRDAKFMNVPNRPVKIQLIADGERVQFIRNGKLIFNFTDRKPFREGWFGFRTVRNHMRIDNFRVYRLRPAGAQAP